VRKSLRWGSIEYEILDDRDAIMKFRDVGEALFFLRRFREDPAQIAMLRSIFAKKCGPAQPVDVDDLLRRIAALLANGRLTLLSSPRMGASVVTEEVTKEIVKQNAPPSSERAPAPKQSWVEFRVLDDETGKPIKGIEITVKLPDGRIEKLKTDEGGYIEINDTLKGECEINCGSDDASSPLFEFVRTA
jgi:hypothetical protein